MIVTPVPFLVGTVFNPIPIVGVDSPFCRSVQVRFPSRLAAMELDGRYVPVNSRMVYPAGEISFDVAITRDVTVTYLDDSPGLIQVDATVSRPVLVRHAVELMRHAFGVSDGIRISIENAREMPHCGLGSSSSLIAAVATSMNELYGRPLPRDILARYLAQNHGEEIATMPDHLVPATCIGASGVAGLYEGAMHVIAGETTVIASARLPADYRAVIAVPPNFQSPDSGTLSSKEATVLQFFVEAGQRFAPDIAYDLVHHAIPGALCGDFGPLGDLIFRRRYNMGGISCCSAVHPQIVQVAEKVRTIKDQGLAPILSLSSLGPAFFAITPTPEPCVDVFEKAGLTCHTVEMYNGTYTAHHMH